MSSYLYGSYINEVEKIKEQQEILNEDLIYSMNKLSIHINPTLNTNYKYDPYIKVYNGPYGSATKVVRIYLKDAGLEYNHSDHFGKLKMTMDLANQLNNIMNIKGNFEYADAKGIKRIVTNITVYEFIWIILDKYFPGINDFPKTDFTKYYIRR